MPSWVGRARSPYQGCKDDARRPRIPTAEEEVLKTFQCEFESHRGHVGHRWMRVTQYSAVSGDSMPKRALGR